MTSNKIDMEIHNVASLEGLKIVFIVLVLVPPAKIGVASVFSAGVFDSILNGAGKICYTEVNVSEIDHPGFIGTVPLSNALESPGPQSSLESVPGW